MCTYEKARKSQKRKKENNSLLLYKVVLTEVIYDAVMTKLGAGRQMLSALD